METTVKQRLMQFLKYKGLSQKRFEAAVGLANGYVNNIRRSVTEDKLQQIALHYPELNKALNIGLRKIKEELGIKELQFYQARHTWASIARNECAIDAYTVDKALNHIPKDMQLLDVYVKKDFRLINEANRKVLEYVRRATK